MKFSKSLATVAFSGIVLGLGAGCGGEAKPAASAEEKKSCNGGAAPAASAEGEKKSCSGAAAPAAGGEKKSCSGAAAPAAK